MRKKISIIGSGFVGSTTAHWVAAKELGDISESGEYEDAKKSQSLLEGRIRELKYVLSRAELIDELSSGARPTPAPPGPRSSRRWRRPCSRPAPRST